MSKKLSNIVKCLILPIAVYVIFFVFSKGRFGSLPGMLAIGRQFVLYCLVGWALMHNQLMGVWDFTPGAVVALAGIIGGNIALSTNTGVAGLVVFCILSAVTLCLLTFFVFHFLKIPSMICGLGMVLIYERLTTQLFGGTGVKLTKDITLLAKSPYCYVVLAVAGIILYILFNFTKNGANTRSLGYGQDIAMSIGVSLTKTRLKNFIIEGIFLGLAAVISSSQRGSIAPTLNMSTLSLGFDAIMGVFIGLNLVNNCNLVVGIVIGTFTMKMVSAGLIAMGLDSNLQSVAQGLFLLVFIGISSNKDAVSKYFADKKKSAEILAKIKA